ncbi:hypothetical protein CC79DRAFT_1347145 [Sarocladium strictum]
MDPGHRRKVSRACDYCKHRKIKCTGTLPCPTCETKGLDCVYDAKYSRGRPPTPPSSTGHSVLITTPLKEGHQHQTEQYNSVAPTTEPRIDIGQQFDSNGTISRASPGLGVAEIEGQVFDPTSGVTFLHRAWRRLAQHSKSHEASDVAFRGQLEQHHGIHAGDRSLPETTEADMYRLTLPPHQELVELLALYFDVCIATYRILHRPSVEEWLSIVESNVRLGKPAWTDLGESKTAIVLACLSLATAHSEKSRGIYSVEDDAESLARSDQLFCVCMKLTDKEVGSPSLHLAQAWIIQCLYLLTTSRMNRAWYTFGNALQLISALGLHRKSTRHRHLAPGSIDYLQSQLRMRTFWTAYVLDKYLGVIFGRPRHYHDEDIDQDLPDRLEDKDITPQGPLSTDEEQLGCHIDGLIFHAKLARIIGQISRKVYSIKPICESERILAAQSLSKEIEEWKQQLPAYLVSVPPSMLITSFRRQSVVLKLGYSHAIMHANRPLLLTPIGRDSKVHVDACLNAARAVFEVVDGLARDGPIFHAFWWTQYVTFCALVVSYTWDIQLKRRGTILSAEEQMKHGRLMSLATKCQNHLAKATARNSPSRRYAVILEEFCSEAMCQKRTEPAPLANTTQRPTIPNDLQPDAMMNSSFYSNSDAMLAGDDLGYSLLDEWNITDWLELDSSAFGPYIDTELVQL